MDSLSDPGEQAPGRSPGAAPPPLRVFVLADVRAFGEGLARLLADEPSFQVVGVCAPDEHAPQRTAAAAPQVVVLDPCAAGTAALIRRLIEANPGCSLLAIGVAADEAALLGCAEAGVGGFVEKGAPASCLVEGLREIAQGKFPCPPDVAAVLFRHIANPGGRARPMSGSAVLTGREREIVALIDRGFTNREIGSALSIEVATVKNHVHNILEKLCVRRRAAAAAKLRGADAASPKDLDPLAVSAVNRSIPRMQAAR
jgi:two-component system nitrate/nitrite response regulator NarL